VFLAADGRRLDRHGAGRIVRKVARRAGITKAVTPHTLRHAASVHDVGLYCPVSELKGDEPRTAERLMKSPDFTGKNLRGFKDTDNPDFIDHYVTGQVLWSTSCAQRR
jgi:hypothetical protein